MVADRQCAADRARPRPPRARAQSQCVLTMQRSAAELGLSPLESQRRRVVFWCAFGIDRELSFALGRSMGIDQADIDVDPPFEFDDDELRSVTSIDDAVRGPDPTIMSGFITSIAFHVRSH